MRLLMIGALGCSALASCAPQEARKLYTVQTRFNSAEVAWSTTPGTASVHGQAFLKTRGGDVKTCAGERVQLTPASGYSREIYQQSQTGYLPGLTNPDLAARAFTRNTICDAQGNFVFKNLSAGSWFIDAAVHWQAPSVNGLVPQGTTMYQPVATQDGQETDIIVTQ